MNKIIVIIISIILSINIANAWIFDFWDTTTTTTTTTTVSTTITATTTTTLNHNPFNILHEFNIRPTITKEKICQQIDTKLTFIPFRIFGFGYNRQRHRNPKCYFTNQKDKLLDNKHFKKNSQNVIVFKP